MGQRMKNKSTALARQRKIKRHEKRESRHISCISFLVFCCSSHSRLFPVSVHTASRLNMRPLRRGSPKMGPEFSAVFTSSWLVFNCRLYIVMSGVQLTIFLFSILRFPERLFCLSFFLIIRTCRRLVADTFLSLTQASASISASTLLFIFLLYHFSLLLSLSICLP